ncbi:NAD(P)/FAD-dependent oxidoreductase [Sphingomonas crocodyli]|uniref:NAD(P)/FAD-dependent oxidoreductase n=1 Tax=Sphingomonas crocodyli TaxID=1979270 RepID=A0A437M5B3_9SPHN|nr:NAD(P)/FAD-dependent oxidoreductase [Sphingomonas crocodyli]RVT92911.1 NAD(P)/FAD-dependent oxidoreductase [Sphingomonas crocodyli]
MADPRIIIVGAGPAGVRAAEVLVKAGVRPTVIDEAAAAGGQIYRRQPLGFRRSARDLYGTEAKRAVAVHNAFASLLPAIDYRAQTLAWDVDGRALRIVAGTVAETLPFDALILACGATDRLFPVAGWTRTGTYSLGAAQIALKAQACSIGRRVVFMGSGPLLYLVAAQYVKAGAQVAAVLDTSSELNRLRALPLMASRPDVLVKGAALLWRLRRAGIPVHRGVTPLAIEGQDAGQGDGRVAALTVRLANGSFLRTNCDAVALGYHLRAETQLADLAGCRFDFDHDSRQWLPTTDMDGRSSVENVYLAGDGVRILGADGAENAGRLAAMAALEDLGIANGRENRSRLRRSQKRMDRFRKGLSIAFPWPAHLAKDLDDNTLVCRCETITAGALRDAACERGAPEVNRAKAFSRVGMGRCQGRYCGLAGAEILAATLDIEIDQVGRLRGQAPIKPLPVATEVKAG